MNRGKPISDFTHAELEAWGERVERLMWRRVAAWSAVYTVISSLMITLAVWVDAPPKGIAALGLLGGLTSFTAGWWTGMRHAERQGSGMVAMKVRNK